MGKFVPTISNHIYVLVDIDGTLTTETEDIGTFELQPNAWEVLNRLHDTKHVHFGVWSCRSPRQLVEAQNKLAQLGLFHVFEHFNGDFVEIVKKYNNNVPRKSSADIYIDDRNTLGKPIDWLEIEEYILGLLKEMGVGVDDM